MLFLCRLGSICIIQNTSLSSRPCHGGYRQLVQVPVNMPPPPVKNGYVDTAEGQVHYRQSGNVDDRPLILLHQSPSSSLMWSPVLPLFAEKGYCAIAFDMPGFGNSFKPRTKPSDISYYTKSILEALDQLGIHGPIDAIGHHTGVCVFLDMAVSNPKRVSKLACWGIPILSEEFRNKLANETPPELDPEGKRVGDWWKWVSTSKHVQNDVHNAIRYAEANLVC